MPTMPTKGTRQTNLELPGDVIDRAKAFAAARGETFSAVVVVALLRHMSNPPPLPQDVPLPPVAGPPSTGDTPAAAAVEYPPTSRAAKVKKGKT